MSGRDRVLDAAVRVGLVVGVLIWSVLGVGLLTSNRPHANASIQSQTASYQRDAVPDAAALGREACAEVNEQSDSSADQREQRDLCAQFLAAAAAQNSANFSNDQTIIGAVGLFAVLLTLALNAVATLAATDQARTARRSIEELERPYLFARVGGDNSGPPTAFAPERQRMEPHEPIEYYFVNHGRSPALITRYKRRRYRRRYSEGPPPPIDPDGDEGWPAPHGVVVPAGQDSQAFQVLEFPGQSTPPQGIDDIEIWYFIGYVVYQDTSGSAEYVKGFCYYYAQLGRQEWYLLGTGQTPDEYNYDRRIEPRKSQH